METDSSRVSDSGQQMVSKSSIRIGTIVRLGASSGINQALVHNLFLIVNLINQLNP